LAWTASGTCICWTSRAGKSKPLTDDPSFNEDLPAWSPDGRQIRVYPRTHERGGDPDGRTDIDVIDAHAGAAPRTVIRPYAPNTQKLAWSPTGTFIAFSAGYGTQIQRLYAGPALRRAGRRRRTPRPLADKLDRGRHFLCVQRPIRPRPSLVEDDGTIYPARIDLSGGAITRRGAGG